MSLDADIANLVAGAQTLVETFEAKSAEIDEAVAAALQTVPQSRTSIYLDATTGDDSNTGTQNDKVQTLKEAISRVPSGGVGVLRLAAGEYSFQHLEELDNKTLLVSGQSGVNDVRIVSEGYVESNLVRTGGFTGNGYLWFNAVTIVTADYSQIEANSPTLDIQYAGFVSSMWQTNIDFRASNVAIEHRDGSLVTTPNSTIKLMLSSVSFTKVATTTVDAKYKHYLIDVGVLSLAVINLTFTGFDAEPEGNSIKSLFDPARLTYANSPRGMVTNSAVLDGTVA